MSWKHIQYKGTDNPNYRHGGNVENRPEYNSWRAMVERCTKPRYWAYARYGGRGITVCERWIKSFPNFLEDMGKKPTPKHSIDRIDNDGDYTPDNCRWATQRQQTAHTNRNRLVEVNGDIMTVSDASRKLGIGLSTIYMRLADGWDLQRAVNQPVRGRK